MSTENVEYEYVGFWVRVGASLIDTVVVVLATAPLLLWFYGWDYFVSPSQGMFAGSADFVITWIFPAAAAIIFWRTRQATPGKMVFSARVVDARTGATLTLSQSIIRYVGYFVSTIPFGLGLVWVAFDAKKQGWHDKIAGTVVIRPKHSGNQAVKFDGA